MSWARLHSLTTIYLAVLYGVVGLTGESLHYLATDWKAVWASTSPTETEGYYHAHFPDHHVHFHRHASHGHSHATSKNQLAITSERPTHQAHACPLLSLTSTLKLSHAFCCTPSTTDTFAMPLFESAVVREFKVALSSCARGPPHGLSV